jgi:hypothetical protein
MSQMRKRMDNMALRRMSKRYKAPKVYGTALEVLTVLKRQEIPEVVRDLVRFIEKGTHSLTHSLTHTMTIRW